MLQITNNGLSYDNFVSKFDENTIFCKIIRSNRTSCLGFTYKYGLNVDHVPFNPTGSCKPGGLYFTTFEHITEFMAYGSIVAFITLCYDAKFYRDPEKNKFKTNKFKITHMFSFAELVKQNIIQTPKICAVTVYEDPFMLKYINNQTPEICMIAVKQNGLVLKYVNLQTIEICEIAVKQNPFSLQYVLQQNEDLCTFAVSRNGLTFQFVNNVCKIRKGCI